MLSHWPKAMWWSAGRNNKKNPTAAQPRFSPVSGPFWVWVGARVTARVRGWVGSTPVPRSDQEELSARKRKQPTGPKIGRPTC